MRKKKATGKLTVVADVHHRVAGLGAVSLGENLFREVLGGDAL